MTAIHGVGIKLSGLSPLKAEKSYVQTLATLADYLEYTAPVLDLARTSRWYNVPLNSLRPHSVLISTACELRPADVVLDRLRSECAATESKYLGEHIGYLNPNSNGPTLGYLFPPPLNLTSVEMIVRNCTSLHSVCGLPLALETPVYYERPQGSTMGFESFIMALSDRLPLNFGWLIDIAHLRVSARNLRLGSFVEVLRCFAQTGRPVYEVHLANTRETATGVMHDDHSTPLSSQVIDFYRAAFRSAKISPYNYTIEFDGGTDDLSAVCAALRRLKNPIVGSEATFRQFSDESIVHPSAALLAEKEAEGRFRLLKNRLLDQLAPRKAIELQSLAELAGFKTLNHLIKDFVSNVNAKHFERHIPYFSATERDGVDLTGAFYEYIRRCPAAFPATDEIVRQLFVDMAVRTTAIRQCDGRSEPWWCEMILAGSVGNLNAGTYHVGVDKANRICIMSSLLSNKSKIRTSFVEGDDQWMTSI